MESETETNPKIGFAYCATIFTAWINNNNPVVVGTE